MVRSQNWVSQRGEISNSIWLILSSESGQSFDAHNVQKCLKRCYIDYGIQLWILLPSGEKNRKHKSKSFVPDVRTERYGYLISIRDMCFECETLVSLPRWALSILSAPFMSDSYACSSQMGPRWSSIFCLGETGEFAGFLYFKAKVIFIRERKTADTLLGITRTCETGRAPREVSTEPLFPLPRGTDCSPCFSYYKCTLLLKVSLLMAEAVSWFYILNLTEREPPSHCHHPYIKWILLYVFWLPQIYLQRL